MVDMLFHSTNSIDFRCMKQTLILKLKLRNVSILKFRKDSILKLKIFDWNFFFRYFTLTTSGNQIYKIKIVTQILWIWIWNRHKVYVRDELNDSYECLRGVWVRIASNIKVLVKAVKARLRSETPSVWSICDVPWNVWQTKINVKLSTLHGQIFIVHALKRFYFSWIIH